MDKKKFIKSYISSSKRRLKYCDDAFNEKDYSYVIRQCQEVVELCSKALLINWNFVVPEKHELSEDLKEISDLFSEKLKKELPEIIKLSKTLRREREPSFYGDERENKSPEELYNKVDTNKLFIGTKKFYNLVLEELKENLN